MRTLTRTLAAVVCAAALLAAGCGGTDPGPGGTDSSTASTPPGAAAALPAFDPTGGADPAVGQVPAVLEGPGVFGDGTVRVTPGEDGPTVVIFAAHWCPHCNRELPRVAQLWRDGGVPDGVRLVLVSAAAREGTENWPPARWLRDDMGWPAELDVLDGDAAAGDVAEAWGLTGFPYFVALDGDGRVTHRHAGEIPEPQLRRVLDDLAG